MPAAGGMPSLGDIDAALASMPATFRNADFRAVLGIYPWPASQMLSMLLSMGIVAHAGSNQRWRVVAAS